MVLEYENLECSSCVMGLPRIEKLSNLLGVKYSQFFFIPVIVQRKCLLYWVEGFGRIIRVLS